MSKQPELYDPLIDAFYKALRKRDFEQIESVLARLRREVSESLQYALWADYFAGILAEERDRNWAAAETKYRSVLERDADPILRAHVLLSLGIAYDKQARWNESVQACKDSASIWEALGYQVKRAVVLRQIAISYCNGYFAGEFEPALLQQAALHCRMALDAFQRQQQLPPEILFYEPDLALYRAITLDQAGNIEAAAGNWQKAVDYYQDLLTIWQQRGDRYHAGYAYWNLGNAYQMLGSSYWEQAELMYHQALSHFREFKEAYYEFNVQASLASLQVRRGNNDRAIEEYDKSLAIIEAMRSGVSSESARSGFFATVVNIYANAVLTQIKRHEVKKAFDYMERARSRAFLDSLTVAATDYTKRIETRTLTCTELQQLLPADTVLLEYYTTGLLKSHGGRMIEQQESTNVLYPTPKTLLFVVTQHDVASYDLGLSPNTLAPSRLEQLIEEHFLPTRLRRALYDLLISPATDWLKGKKRLYIIPHGPLHYIPFHALVAPDGDTLLRKEGPEIVYAPSATILFREPPPREQLPTRTCLAIGYNGEAGMQLRFAEEEAAYIAQIAGGAALVGPSAKKAALYQQAPDYQALHFSCHGEFDPDSPLESVLHIGPGETLTGQEIIDHLHLNCDLVTLSACESGLSKVQRGDELYGLIRAFLYAGAPAIIATLWRVDERSTLIFAERFYQSIQQGLAYATALKAAQLYLKSLTRKAALEILTQHMAGTISANTSDDFLQLQADRYLKTLAAAHATQIERNAPGELLPAGHDDDPIFADPKFWAPFVLIGAP